MNKPFRILGMLALSAVALTASAVDDENTVRVVGKDKDGRSVGVVPVNLESKIRFTSDKVEIYDGDTQKGSFRYADIATLSFVAPGGSGVTSVEAQAPLALVENPVGDTLLLSGFEGSEAPLAIYGLDGALKVSVAEWHGEPVDVSFLSSGLYFVTINRTTLKFIKK